ncbi:MAG TPA: DUF1127 domain-containing protein [Stellaceae bacterium]
MDSSEDDLSSVPDVAAAGLPVPADRDGLYARLSSALAQWQARSRSRRLLAALDEHMLRDIGIDPARVWQETEKWFWQK